MGLTLIQLFLALWVYGQLPDLRAGPHPVGTARRLTGMFAFLFYVPIAQQCILAYGVSLTRPARRCTRSPAVFSTGPSSPRSSWCATAAGRAGRSLSPVGALVTVIALAWYPAAFWCLNGLRAPGL